MQEATNLVFDFNNQVKNFVPKWKRWDSRPDGKVFWQYAGKHKTEERWVTVEAAMRNQESLRRASSKQRAKNPDRHKENNKLWRKKNAAKHCQNAREYYKANRLKANETKRKRRAERRKSDPLFALKTSMRTLISKAFKNKGYSKTSLSEKIIGCDWASLKLHIESQFIDGMSWDNRSDWHIDHIIPLASATTLEDVDRLNHYLNLRPLWAIDNLRKGARTM